MSQAATSTVESSPRRDTVRKLVRLLLSFSFLIRGSKQLSRYCTHLHEDTQRILCDGEVWEKGIQGKA